MSSPTTGRHTRETDSLGVSLPPERAGTAALPDLIEKRGQFAGRTYDGPIPLDWSTLGGVPCAVLDGGGDCTVLYLHGGGYRMGSANAYVPYGARLAEGSGARVVIVDYRLAPEAPYPAAVRDVAAVYAALRDEDPARPIIITGDSAGGGLAAALAVLAAREGAPPPDGMAVLSPWLDMRCQGSTYATATDPIFDLATAESARASYLQGHDESDPLVSPILADPACFPPTLIQVGTTETLLSDAWTLATRIIEFGTSCELHAVARRGHTWPLVQPFHADAASAIDALNRFIRPVGARRTAADPS